MGEPVEYCGTRAEHCQVQSHLVKLDGITRQGSSEANGGRMGINSAVNSMTHVSAGYVLVD